MVCTAGMIVDRGSKMRLPDASPGLEAEVSQAQASADGDRAVDREALKVWHSGRFRPEAAVAEGQEGCIPRRCNACTRHTTHTQRCSTQLTWPIVKFLRPHMRYPLDKRRELPRS